jgi:hypothetical protein
MTVSSWQPNMQVVRAVTVITVMMSLMVFILISQNKLVYLKRSSGGFSKNDILSANIKLILVFTKTAARILRFSIEF